MNRPGFLSLALSLWMAFPLSLLALEPLSDQPDPFANQLPMLPGSDAPAPGAAAQTDTTLPPLPGGEVAAPSQPAAQSDLPPLPAAGDQPAASQQELPPLPGTEPAAAGTQEAMPPLPGQEPQAAPAAAPAQAAAPEEMPPLPGQTPVPKAEISKGQTAANTAKAKKESRPWEATKKRVNAILGGWVRAKGGNETSRIAWASQGALNALVLHGYKVLDEKGLYEGQAGAQGNQWRLITFEAPKVHRNLEVYVTDLNGRVWMRVGPSEPPAFSANSIAQVKAIRSDSVKALGLIRKELKGRIRPHRGKSWEAPYSFALATADHR